MRKGWLFLAICLILVIAGIFLLQKDKTSPADKQLNKAFSEKLADKPNQNSESGSTERVEKEQKDVELEIKQTEHTEELTVIPKGKLGDKITSVIISNLTSGNANDLRMKQLRLGNDFLDAYAIDPTRLNFTKAKVTVKASGNMLLKCNDWDYDTDECAGTWERLQRIKQGQEYTFNLTPDDPAFGEINATDADHLDENHTLLSNIYDKIKQKDNNWSEPIYQKEYIRVYFENNLTNGSIIDVYARSNGTIAYFDVYEAGTQNKVGKSGIIDKEEAILIIVKNLTKPTDTFDFQIVKVLRDNDTIAEDNTTDIDPNVTSYLQYDFIHDQAINSTTAEGLLAYSELNTPTIRYRLWNSTTNDFTLELVDANFTGGDITWVTTKANHERDEIIVVTQNVQLDLAAQVFNSTKQWGNAIQLSTGIENNAQRGHDLAFEQLSGDALVVYENSNAPDVQLAYRKWNGTWSNEAIFDFANVSAEIRWIELVPKPGTNQIMLAAMNDLNDVTVMLWNGTSFDNTTRNVTTTSLPASTTKSWAFAWEQQSGDGLFVYGEGTSIFYKNYTATTNTWSGPGTIGSFGNSIKDLKLCSDPTTDYIGMIEQDGGNDVNVRMWNGSQILTGEPLQDGTTEGTGASAINVDCAWQTDGNRALFGFVDVNALAVSHFNFTKPNTWSTADLETAPKTVDFASDDIKAIDFTPHPTTNEIMIVAFDILEDITGIRWDGTGFTTISASPYEPSTEPLNGNEKGAMFDWTRYDPPPSVTGLLPIAGSTFNASEIIEISANVTDNIAVDTVLANITIPNGTTQQTTLTLATGNKYNTSFTIPNISGQYTIRIIANDTNNNINSTETTTFNTTIQDTTPPNITFDTFIAFINSTDNTTVLNETTMRFIEQFRVQFNITDDTQLDRLRLFFRNTNGSAQDTCQGTINSSVGTMGNLQKTDCFEFLEFDNETTTTTLDRQTFLGDGVILQELGNNMFEWQIDEVYKPVFKNYPFNASTAHFNQSINLTSMDTNIRYLLDSNFTAPSDADLYMLSARFNFTPGTGELQVFLCNSSYPDGLTPQTSSNCVFLGSKPTTDFKGTKISYFFSNDTIATIGTLKNASVVYHQNRITANTSQFYFPQLVQVFNSSIQNITFYSTDGVTTETSLFPLSMTTNLHWFYEGKTCFEFFVAANDTSGNSKNSTTQQRCWADFGLNFPPTAPKILTPTPNQNISGKFNITWADGIDQDGDDFNISIFLFNPNGTLNFTIALNNITKGTQTFEFDTTQASDGKYRINLTANDTLGASSSTLSNFNFTIDNTPPGLAVGDCVPDPANVSQIVVCNATVTDALTGVSTVLANVTLPNGSVVDAALQFSGSLYNFSFNVSVSGVHTVKWFANDTSGNSANASDSFTAGTPPSVTIVAPLGETFDEDASVSISTNVTDTEGIDKVIAEVTLPNGTKTNLTLGIGLESDSFDADTNGTVWEEVNEPTTGQTCILNVNTSSPGKMHTQITGTGMGGFSSCGFVSVKRMDGDFDLNISWDLNGKHNLGSFADFQISEFTNLSVASKVALIRLTNSSTVGRVYQLIRNDNGTATIVSSQETSDLVGKYRITRTENNFTFFIFNNTASTWDVFNETLTLNLSRALHLRIDIVDFPPYGNMNISWENFTKTGDNFTFGLFNQTWLNGQYNVTILSNDTSGALNDTEKTTFNISFINDPPSEPTVISPAVNQKIRRLFNITWEIVTDEEGDILQYNITLLNADFTFNTTIVENLSDGGRTTFEWNTTQYADGKYNLKVIVFENETIERNSNSDKTNSNFTIDNTPPSVLNLTPASDSEFLPDEKVNITTNVTDLLVGVSVVKATIQLPNSSTRAFTLTNVSDVYSIEFNETNTRGNYTVNITANDTVGNTNSTETTFFVINSPPAVNEIRPENGSNFTNPNNVQISAIITDFLGVDTVIANITLPNGSTNTSVMKHDEYAADNETILLLHFNEEQGTPVDSSNNTFNITLKDIGIEKNVTGKFGKGIKFNDTGQNGSIRIADNNLLDFNSTQSFTIEFWINGTPTGEDHSIINKLNLTGTNKGYYLFMDLNDILVFRITNGTINITLSPTTNVHDGTFHHVAATRNVQTQNCTLFIDGTSEATTTCPPMNLTNNQPIQISDSAGIQQPGDDQLDELRISNTARTGLSPNFYRTNFTNVETTGIYTAQIIANDTRGKVNNTQTTTFEISQAIAELVNISSLDSDGIPVNVTLIILNSTGDTVFQQTNTTFTFSLPTGVYNITQVPQNQSGGFLNFTIVDANITGSFNLEKFDYPEEKFATGVLPFALDPAVGINFSFIKVLKNATNQALYKCADWNFTTGTCGTGCNETDEESGICEINATWTKIKENLTTGQIYSFTLNQTDPGFSEYSESEGENSTTSTTFINKTTTTFAPTKAGKHLIIATAQLHGNSQTSSVLARLLVDGINVSNVIWEPKDAAIANDYQAYGTHIITSLNTSNHTITLQWASEIGDATFIKNARISVINFIGDVSNTSKESEIALTTTLTNITNLTITPPQNKTYLVIATGELQTGGCTQSATASLTLDGTDIDNSSYECKDPTDYKPFFFHKQVNMTASTQHNLSIRAKRTSNGGNIRRVRISAIPITPDLDAKFASNDTEASVSCTGTSCTSQFVNHTILTFTPLEPADYLFMATAQFNSGGGNDQTQVDLVIDNNVSCNVIQEIKNNGNPDQLLFVCQKNTSLNASTHTAMIRFRAQGSSPTSTLRNARITAIRITPDTAPPAVFDVRPIANSAFNVSDIIEIAANATDLFRADTVLANITLPNGSINLLTLSKAAGTDKFNNTFTIPNQIGTYNITFIANDTSNNINSTSTTFFVGEDNIFPTVLNVTALPSVVNQTQTVNISANVTDSIAVSTVKANITFPNGNVLLLVMQNNSVDLYNVSFTSSINDVPGVYNVTILANDTSGNLNNTEKTNFTVNDVTPPAVLNVSAQPSILNQTQPVNITANVTDAAISIVLVNITLSNGTTRVLTMTNVTDIFNITLIPAVTDPPGVYNVTILANDTSGNLNNTEKTNFTVNDVLGPNIFLITPQNASTESVNISFEVAANVTDFQIDIATANITSPTGNSTLLQLLPAGNRKFNASFTTPELGNYTIFIIANDTTGNQNTTPTTFFKVIIADETPPVVLNITPTENTTFLINDTVFVSANVTDANSSIQSVTANVTLPNGTVLQASLTEQTTDIFSFNFTNLTQRGNYNVTIISTDSAGNVNATEGTRFERIPINIIDIINSTGDPIPFEVNITTAVNQTFDLNITLQNFTIKQILVFNHSNLSALSVIKLENETNDDPDFMQSYAIDTSQFNASFINVTVTASGNFLFKCPTFDFNTQQCLDFDNYTQILRITPNTTYTFLLNSTDPGFGETVTGPDNINDSFINEALPNQNNGNLARMIVGTTGTGVRRRGIIKFNISNIPDGVRIDNATLKLFFFSAPGPDTNRTHGVHKVTKDWAETEVTWNDFKTGQAWTTPGGDFNTTSSNVTFDESLLNTFIEFNVTSDVQQFINNRSSNFGWLVRDQNETGPGFNTRRGYRTKNFGGDISQIPQLVINFTDITPPGINNAFCIPDPANISQIVTCNATVTDNINVSTTSANVTLPDGIVIFPTLTNISANFSFLFGNTTIQGVYNVSWFANDTSGNNNTIMFNFTVNDVTAPAVFDVRPVANSTFNVSDVIKVSSNATDNIAVDIVLANITLPNGSAQLITLVRDGITDKYNNTFSIPNVIGQYDVRFITNDTSGNINSTETTNFIVAESTPPEVFNATAIPSTVNQTQTVNITANVTDNVAVDTVRANITFPNGTSILTGLNNATLEIFNATFTPSITDPIGTYNVTILANDTSGNLNNTETTNFTVNDVTLPSVVNVTALPAQVEQGQTLNISANVTDNLDVDIVIADITFPDGSSTAIFLLNSTSDTFNNTFTVTIDDPVGLYNVTILANDTSNNVNGTETTNFTVLDAKPPAVLNVTALPSVINQTQTVNISANVTDNVSVDTVRAQIIFPNSTVILLMMVNSTNDLYNVTFTPSLFDVPGIYNVTILANDTRNNINNTETASFTVNDVTLPAVLNVAATPTVINLSQGVNISANITDNIGIGIVIADITFPNGSTTAIFLLNATKDIFNNTFTTLVTDPAGVYNVTILANDTSNNVNTTEKTNFTVLDATAPNITIIGCSPNPANLSQIVTCNATVTDNNFLDSVLANVTAPNGITFNVTVQNTTTNFFFTFGNTTIIGQFNVTWSANDTSNNNAAEFDNFTIEDITPPTVINVTALPSAVNQTQTVNISANVTDNVSVDVVLANITFPNGSSILLNMTNTTGIFAVNFTPLISDTPGIYNVTILANDTSGNINNTETTSFTVKDVTPPQVLNITPTGQSFNSGSGVPISANVTDNINADVVIANITNPINTTFLISLSNSSKDVFTGTFTNTSVTGFYNITILANDTSNNLNSTEKSNFTIITPPPAAPPAAGGGGGGGRRPPYARPSPPLKPPELKPSIPSAPAEREELPAEEVPKTVEIKKRLEEVKEQGEIPLKAEKKLPIWLLLLFVLVISLWLLRHKIKDIGYARILKQPFIHAYKAIILALTGIRRVIAAILIRIAAVLDRRKRREILQDADLIYQQGYPTKQKVTLPIKRVHVSSETPSAPHRTYTPVTRPQPPRTAHSILSDKERLGRLGYTVKRVHVTPLKQPSVQERLSDRKNAILEQFGVRKQAVDFEAKKKEMLLALGNKSHAAQKSIHTVKHKTEIPKLKKHKQSLISNIAKAHGRKEPLIKQGKDILEELKEVYKP